MPKAVPTPRQKARATLTRKQEAFVKEYARYGNMTQAAKKAGYKGKDATLCVVGYENLRKPSIIAAVQEESDSLDRIEDYGSLRVKRRLDKLSHGAEAKEQFGVAVRAEELIGKAAGMFVDQSISLTANLSGDHLKALLEVARERQAQPVDLDQNNTQIVRKPLLDE